MHRIELTITKINQLCSRKLCVNIGILFVSRSFCWAFLLDGLGGMFREQFALVRPNDAVIAISFSPYAEQTVELVQLAAGKGVKQIAITDSTVSPLAQFCEVSFVMREAQMDGFRSQLSSMCLAQTLVLSLAAEEVR